jgi:hypothetical protein
MKGCPRHSVADRKCSDMRCLMTWKPAGALSPEEQLQRWAIGDSVCPNENHECCPDFSCCKPRLAWSLEKRQKFLAAGQGEREKMMMGALRALVEGVDKKAYVTRGNPKDRE